MILTAFPTTQEYIGRRQSTFMKLLLTSVVICAIGYLGLALSHVWVRSVAGVTWSLVMLAAWTATATLAFRRPRTPSCLAASGAPVILLSFYAICCAPL
jgi:hypothetical protein